MLFCRLMAVAILFSLILRANADPIQTEYCYEWSGTWTCETAYGEAGVPSSCSESICTPTGYYVECTGIGTEYVVSQNYDRVNNSADLVTPGDFGFVLSQTNFIFCYGLWTCNSYCEQDGTDYTCSASWYGYPAGGFDIVAGEQCQRPEYGGGQ